MIRSAALLLVMAVLSGCSLLSEPKNPARQPVPNGTVASVPEDTTSTIVGVLDGDGLCTLITQADLATAGVAGRIDAGSEAGGLVTLGTGAVEEACIWLVTTADNTFELTLTVAEGVDSAAYERVLADPTADDPGVVDGLGEMAAYGEAESGRRADVPTAFVVAFEYGRVVKLDSLDRAAIGQDQLVALVRVVLGRL